MVEILEVWLPVVNALILAPVAWRSPAQLAAALGADVEPTTDLLCLLDVEGWIDVWDCDSGPVVTLSALAAERLHVHLIEVGPQETPRWARVGDPIPPPPKARHVCISERAAALDAVPDPAPPPDVAAELSEWEMRNANGDLSSPDSATHTPKAALPEFARPTVLVGLGLTPWPGPALPNLILCPACRGARLGPARYCLYCDRWGLDHLLPTLPSARKPSSPPRPAPSLREKAHQERLQLDRERARRKAKRRRRHQAKLEEEGLRHRMRSLKTDGGRLPNDPASVPPKNRVGPGSLGQPRSLKRNSHDHRKARPTP